jgi:hypothetical protein
MECVSAMSGHGHPPKPEKKPKALPPDSISDYGPRIIDLLQRVAALEAQVAAMKE